jgi:peptide/nickel transport system substrate-binding protein
MEKIDDYTVKFYLTDSRPTFMYYFTGYNMIMLSSDYDYAGMGVTKPMGTGPFKAKEILVGEGAVLTKNENYWKSGYPKVDEIRYYFISDMETKMNMLEQGKADIVRDMAIGNLDRINKNPNLKYDIPYTYFRIIYMNVEKEPFNDPRVVEALKYCVDPEVLANVNMGKLGDNIFFSEFHIGVSQREYKKIAPRKRDIAKAKALLAEAGYADGVDLDIYYESDIDFSSAIALSLQEQAAPAGFRIKLKGNPRDIYLAQFWLNVGFGITAWSPRVDPSLILDLAYKTGGSWNESHLASPEADRIMNAILSELDEAKRIQLYGELQQWFHDKGPVMTIQVPFIVAQTKRVLEYNEPMTRIIKIEDIDLAQ